MCDGVKEPQILSKSLTISIEIYIMDLGVGHIMRDLRKKSKN